MKPRDRFKSKALNHCGNPHHELISPLQLVCSSYTNTLTLLFFPQRSNNKENKKYQMPSRFFMPLCFPYAIISHTRGNSSFFLISMDNPKYLSNLKAFSSTYHHQSTQSSLILNSFAMQGPVFILFDKWGNWGINKLTIHLKVANLCLSQILCLDF